MTILTARRSWSAADWLAWMHNAPRDEVLDGCRQVVAEGSRLLADAGWERPESVVGKHGSFKGGWRKPESDIVPAPVVSGAAIREARQSRGWTQAYLAQIAHLKRSEIANIEADFRPFLEAKRHLARLLGIAS